MKQMDGKIGIREYSVLIFYTIGAKVTDGTPTLLHQSAKNASWLAMLLLSIMAIVPIVFLLKVISAHKGKNLVEILTSLFGVSVGKIIAFFLFLFGFFLMVLDSAMYVELVGTMYYSMTPFIAIYGILFLVCGYGAIKGLQAIGSVAWASYYYLQASVLLILILIFKGGNFGFIYPIFGPGIADVLKTSVKYVSIYGDLLFFSMIAPMVSSYQAFRKGTILFFMSFLVQSVIIFMLFVMLFDFTSLEVLKFPYHESLRYISLGFLQNTETIFFPIWLIAVFVRFAIYLYLASFLFGAIFNIHEFRYLVPVMSILSILFGQLIKTPVHNTLDYREMLLTSFSPVFMLLPVLMWFVLSAKRRLAK